MGRVWNRISAAVALAAIAAGSLAGAPANAKWGPVQDLATFSLLNGLPPFAFASNARGDRLVVWDSGDGFAFAQAPPGRRFGAPVQLRPTDGYNEFLPDLEMDERGNALLLWSYFDQTAYYDRTACCEGLRARVIRADGSVTDTQTLVPRGYSVSRDRTDMQIGRDGRMGVVFPLGQYQSESWPRLAARFGTVDKGFGRLEHIGGPSYAQQPSLSFAGGRAHVTYMKALERGKGAQETGRARIVDLERRRADSYRPGRTIVTPMRLDSLRVATASSGDQVALWARERPGFATIVYVATRAAGGPFRPRRLARESRFTGPYAAPSIEPGGNALAYWGSALSRSIVTSLRLPGHEFGALTHFGPSWDGIVTNPVVASVNAPAHALIVWVDAPGSGQGTRRLVAAFRNARGAELEEHEIARDDGNETYGFMSGRFGVTLDNRDRASVVYVENARLKAVTGRIGPG